MGREWLLSWGGSGGGVNGRSSKRGRSGGGQRNTTNNTTTATTASSSSSGCMSAVFQLFDLHQFQLAVPQHPNSFIPYDSIHLPEEANIVLKGVEAPRNSLESEGPVVIDRLATSSSMTTSSMINEEHSLNLPMGIQIKTSITPTSASKSRTDDLSSECSSSPGTKTPNLVARLMGLDLLPELSSPRVSSSSNYSTTPPPNLIPSKSPSTTLKSSSSHHQSHCRSLPETPRISLMGRASDADENYHHRHSLQVNKENIFTNEEFDLSSFLSAKLARRREYSCRQGDHEMNSSSSSLYAKEIVKQVKENISRRVGADITNTVLQGGSRKREKEQVRRDEHLVLLKPKKPFSRMGQEESCSPRLRLLEVKNKPISPSPPKTHENSLSPKSQVPSTVPSKEKKSQQPLDKVKNLKKTTSYNQKYDSIRLKKATDNSEHSGIKNKQEEPFIRSLSTTNKVKKQLSAEKKCRKIPLSNNLVNINIAPKFLSFKKDPSPSTRRSPQNQVSSVSRSQLSKSQSRSYNSKATHMLSTRYNCRGEDNHISGSSSANPILTTTPTTTAQEAVVVHYISRILTYCGIDRNTPISITQWYSPSHPLHPSILQRLQLSTTIPTPTAVASSTSSKLMFDLVDELLVEILKPYLNMKPWVLSSSTSSKLCGWQLTEKLSERIGSFPEADCRVLEDIDALIDSDMRKSTQLLRSIAFEEEGEGIVTEIERDIVDTLVHETAVLMWHVRRAVGVSVGGGGGVGKIEEPSPARS